MEFRDPYAVLGVSRDASPEDIKQAWRRLARRHHPDVNGGAAASRMSEINEAYAILSDPARRADHDAGAARGRRDPFSEPRAWHEESTSDEVRDDPVFRDIFSELMRKMGGAATGSDRDRRATLVLDLEDAFLGGRRELQIEMPDGRQRTFEVKIPLGIAEGQGIRLAGLGHGGRQGQGDLLLEVRFRPHPRWRLEGRDLIGELPLAPWEAALGAEVAVTLPGGRGVKVRVPRGTTGDGDLVVRGRGLPAAEPGDLHLRPRIVWPSADDPRARRIYERMAGELSDFDPRAPRRD